MFSKAPIDQIHLLGSPFCQAIQSSNQWQIESSRGETTTDCLAALIPEGQNDISINLIVGRRAGLEMLDLFKLLPTWSASPTHLTPPPQTQEEQNAPHL
jgi:hypothetical protein